MFNCCVFPASSKVPGRPYAMVLIQSHWQIRHRSNVPSRRAWKKTREALMCPYISSSATHLVRPRWGGGSERTPSFSARGPSPSIHIENWNISCTQFCAVLQNKEIHFTTWPRTDWLETDRQRRIIKSLTSHLRRRGYWTSERPKNEQ